MLLIQHNTVLDGDVDHSANPLNSNKSISLALHLQKLYERLIDYEPKVEYSRRLNQLSRVVGNHDAQAIPSDSHRIGTRGIRASLLAQKEKRDSLALTRVLTSHEAALQLNYPKGLLLHGEVGTGKSMLIDLFATVSLTERNIDGTSTYLC